MGRPKRAADRGLIDHVLNRANARLAILEKDVDYFTFEQVVGEALARRRIWLLSSWLWPNHGHLVVWPEQDRELPRLTHLADANRYALVARPSLKEAWLSSRRFPGFFWGRRGPPAGTAAAVLFVKDEAPIAID